MTVRGSISRAVTSALKDAQLPPRDAAGVALVKRYAAILDTYGDDPAMVGDLGPKLLAALTALGLTAAGRAAKGGSSGVAAVAGKLDELRARREKRAG